MRLLERTTPKPAKYNARRSITASAAPVNLRDRNQLQAESNNRAVSAEWQGKAWQHYDSIGEIKFAYGLVASVMSRVRLYPAVIVDPDAPPVALTDAASIERPEAEIEDTEGAYHPDVGIHPTKAVEARDMFRRSVAAGDVPSMMRSFALNVSVPGECYLALVDGVWQIKSTSELIIDTSGTAKLKTSRSGIPRDLPKDTTIGRIWREHPRFSYEPDSAMMALDDDCEELLLLGRVIRTNSRARLNAGILFVPDEITVASTSVTDDQEIEEDEESQFESELYQTLTAAILDEDNASSVYPLLLRGPGDLGDKIRHILLERKIDEFLVQRADRTLERILQGLDVPKDIVTGLANVKYSNAIQIDESLYKAHVEPLCLMICDAITDIIFRPLLRAGGWSAEEAARMVVWYDPSEVTTRPDRAADAKNLYDSNELSGSALRQAHGYSDLDKPSEEELAQKVAMANPPPPEVMMLLLQSVLPTVLKRLASSAGAGGELPANLQNTLQGEDPTAAPEIPPTLEEQ